MSHIRIWRAADRHPQRWKNGGGLTSEVATFPAGAGLADFDWRISVAEVGQAGPFSYFDSVDRVLTVLDGELALTFESGGGGGGAGESGPVRLTSRSEPFAFAGDIPVAGMPVGGPVRDLNVMVRRGRASAMVQRIRCAPQQLLGLPGCCVLVALGDLAIGIGNQDHRLAALDAMLVEDASSAIAVPSDGEGGLIVVAIDHTR